MTWVPVVPEKKEEIKYPLPTRIAGTHTLIIKDDCTSNLLWVSTWGDISESEWNLNEVNR